jgi:hypothetical protein
MRPPLREHGYLEPKSEGRRESLGACVIPNDAFQLNGQPRNGARDPSLRLKNGSARDDAHHKETRHKEKRADECVRRYVCVSSPALRP